MNRHQFRNDIELVAILVIQSLATVVLFIFVFSRLSVAPVDVYKKVEELDAKISSGILDRWTGQDQRIFAEQLKKLNPDMTVPVIEE